MKENKKNMKDYLMVNYFDCRGVVGIREVREVKMGSELDVDFIWRSLDEFYDGEYEEMLISWLGEENIRSNFGEFLEGCKIEKEDFIYLEVMEEDCVMFIEGEKIGDDVLKLVEERIRKLF